MYNATCTNIVFINSKIDTAQKITLYTLSQKAKNKNKSKIL